MTFSILQSWRQRGRVDAESTDEITNTQEKSQVSTGDTRFIGVVVGNQTEEIIKNIPRVEEDRILLIAPVKINGKELFTLIDSGVTCCFVTRQCCNVAGLSCVPHDTFLELGNGTTALSRGMMQGTPITLVSATSRIDLIVSHLLHDVDIVLGINWLKSINPIIDWCSGRVYLPAAVHTALLEGKWLSFEHEIGTAKVLSDSAGLKSVKNSAVQNPLAILKTPKFWTAVNSRTNFSKGAVHQYCKEDRDCKISSRLFIQEDKNFGHLYIKNGRIQLPSPSERWKELLAMI